MDERYEKKLQSAKQKKLLYTSSVLFGNLSQKEKEIVKLYQTNLTLTEIAKKMGIGRTTRYNIIRKLGLKRARQFKYKGYDKKKILELKKLGLSEVAIAKKLGVSPTTYRHIKQVLGIHVINENAQLTVHKAQIAKEYYKQNDLMPECPHKTNILEKYHDTIVKLLESGISKTEIAKRYNVCTTTVFNFIYLYGIKAPVIKKTDNEKLIIQLFQQGYSQRKKLIS